jgi:hypothetical protein
MDVVVQKLIEEYNARKGDCLCCIGTDCKHAMCGQCTKESCFKDKLDLKSFIIMRVATDAEKEFSESDLAAKLSAKAELRKNVYEDFSRYVDSQKEFLDKMLDEYSQSYHEAKHILDKHRRSFVLTKVESVLSAVGEKIE